MNDTANQDTPNNEARDRKPAREDEILPVHQQSGAADQHAPEQRAPKQHAPGQNWEARITFLRSRAAVARAEVGALEALHRDPETLEELLIRATPEEVALAEAVEHRISERVTAARQVADAAEADYERAVLDGPGERDTDDTV